MNGPSKTRNIDLPLQLRAASVVPSSFDESARTVDVVWTTGAAVRRFVRGEIVDESLDLSGAALSRLNTGAPVLNAHRSYSVRDIVGVVVEGSARIAGDTGVATVRFSEREDVQALVGDVRGGIVRNVSVGYSVERYERIAPVNDGDRAELVARQWTPLEISFVPVGADPDAGTRADGDVYQCELTGEPAEMDKQETPKAEVRAVETPAIDVEKLKTESAVDAVAKERARVRAIETCGRATGLADIARGHIDDGTGKDTAIEAMIARAADAQKTLTPSFAAGDGMDGGERFGRDAVAMITHRARPDAFEFPEAAQSLRHATFADIARTCLRHAGKASAGMSNEQVVEAALDIGRRNFKLRGGVGYQITGDFSNILANSGFKMLRRAYDESPSSHPLWTQRMDRPNFQIGSAVALSSAPDLALVPEHGEIPIAPMLDSGEPVQVATYANRVAVTRQVLVNDDLGAFNRLFALQGRAANRKECDLNYNVLLDNANLSDGIPLFDALHNNIAAVTGGPSLTTFAEATRMLGLQTGLQGEKLNLMATVVVVPVEHRFVAEQLFMGPLFPDAVANARAPQFMSGVMVVSDARLDVGPSNNAWYVMAANQIDTVWTGGLNGQSGPGLESRDGFEILGREYRVVLDSYAKAIDFRGMIKINGA